MLSCFFCLACVWRAFLRAGQTFGTRRVDFLAITGHCANPVALGICDVFAVGRILTRVDTVAETSGYDATNDVALACSLLVAVATAL